jgi:thioredoxin reductase
VREGHFEVPAEGKTCCTRFVITASDTEETLATFKTHPRFFGISSFTCMIRDGYYTTGRKLLVIGQTTNGVSLSVGMKRMSTADVTFLPTGALRTAGAGKERANLLQEKHMKTELDFADILQELHDAKKTGALYVRILETSEDLYRLFFKNGNICHIRYGSAVGKDCLDILEYYNLVGATFFDGINVPDRPASDLPDTEQIISMIRGFNKKVFMR